MIDVTLSEERTVGVRGLEVVVWVADVKTRSEARSEERIVLAVVTCVAGVKMKLTGRTVEVRWLADVVWVVDVKTRSEGRADLAVVD